MNLIKRNNQRTVIHLTAQGEGYLARVVVCTVRYDGSYASHVVAVQVLTKEQAIDLKSKASALQAYNIFLVDTTQETPAAVYILPFSIHALPGSVTISEPNDLGKVIPSPYFSKITSQEAFFSTQQTRGPNINA